MDFDQCTVAPCQSEPNPNATTTNVNSMRELLHHAHNTRLEAGGYRSNFQAGGQGRLQSPSCVCFNSSPVDKVGQGSQKDRRCQNERKLPNSVHLEQEDVGRGLRRATETSDTGAIPQLCPSSVGSLLGKGH